MMVTLADAVITVTGAVGSPRGRLHTPPSPSLKWGDPVLVTVTVSERASCK